MISPEVYLFLCKLLIVRIYRQKVAQVQLQLEGQGDGGAAQARLGQRGLHRGRIELGCRENLILTSARTADTTVAMML